MWRLIPLTFLPASNPTGSIEGPLFAPLWRSGCRECQPTGWPRGLPARAPRHRVHREYAPACRPTPTARNSCAPCSSAGNPSAGAATGSRSPARKAARRPRRGYRPRADDRRVWPAGSTVPGSPIPRPSDRLGIATPIGHSVLGSPSSTCGAPPQSTAPHIESQPARPTQLLSGRALRNEGGDRSWADIVSRIRHLFTVKDRKAIDLLDDIADMDRRRWRSAILHLDAKRAQIVGRDFGEQSVFPNGKDVAIEDGFTHRPRAVRHPRFLEPPLANRPKVLGRRQPPLLSLLFLSGRVARCNPLPRGQASLSRLAQRHSVRPVSANRQGL